jgi:hypothetical protein
MRLAPHTQADGCAGTGRAAALLGGCGVGITTGRENEHLVIVAGELAGPFDPSKAVDAARRSRGSALTLRATLALRAGLALRSRRSGGARWPGVAALTLWAGRTLRAGFTLFTGWPRRTRRSLGAGWTLLTCSTLRPGRADRTLGSATGQQQRSRYGHYRCEYAHQFPPCCQPSLQRSLPPFNATRSALVRLACRMQRDRSAKEVFAALRRTSMLRRVRACVSRTRDFRGVRKLLRPRSGNSKSHFNFKGLRCSLGGRRACGIALTSE